MLSAVLDQGSIPGHSKNPGFILRCLEGNNTPVVLAKPFSI